MKLLPSDTACRGNNFMVNAGVRGGRRGAGDRVGQLVRSAM
ncbi:hypothetical protein EV384_1184 [Micromonospora kangleipakensis]|uniref:Uncharacterized protein n=1 Tax=Micromonospora kangleipakensis TaxID=1077942 RepID=A0A4Q8B5E1_9ACTN|nr:hypothetical protein EV384_1184 [Micromonospora kangleipakensis]